MAHHKGKHRVRPDNFRRHGVTAIGFISIEPKNLAGVSLAYFGSYLITKMDKNIRHSGFWTKTFLEFLAISAFAVLTIIVGLHREHLPPRVRVKLPPYVFDEDINNLRIANLLPPYVFDEDINNLRIANT